MEGKEELIYEERVTVNGNTFSVKRKDSQQKFLDVEYPSSLKINIFDPNLITPNLKNPEATTLRIIQGGNGAFEGSRGGIEGFYLEVSKRRKPMPYWHRNMDNDELIICVRGKVTWKTELGKTTLNPGEMILIPKGVAHTVVPDESIDYVAIEIKSPYMKVLLNNLNQ